VPTGREKYRSNYQPGENPGFFVFGYSVKKSNIRRVKGYKLKSMLYLEYRYWLKL
jgi:hypothetical protein